MVNLGKYIIIIFLSCLLFACASARMAEEVQSGKVTFNSGNFKLAFQQLLPLAVKNCAEAQYAVGYMYYYGLGVEAHRESALFWISRAAEQMYRPAIKALPMMQNATQINTENTNSQPLPQISRKTTDNKQVLDPVRMAVKVTPENREDAVLASLKYNKPQLNTVAKSKTITKTLKAADIASHEIFTLQLFGSHKLSDVKKLKSQLKLTKPTRYAIAKRKERDWYILTYGKYSGVNLAKSAKESLPQNVRKLNPWVRNVNDLRWLE